MRDFDVKQGFERLQVAGLGNLQALQKFLHGIFAADVFDCGLRAESGISGEDHYRTRGIQSGEQADDGIVFGGGMVRRGREEYFRLIGQGMHVEDREIPFARAGIETLEDKFLGAGNVEQREIFGGRSDENQIVILCVVEREQCAALDAEWDG